MLFVSSAAGWYITAVPITFNRLTSRALQVLFYARSKAGQLGSSAVEPRHILLGVLDERRGLGSRTIRPRQSLAN